MTYRSLFILAVAAALAVTVLGCGDDDAPVSPPECEAIVERCHPLDTGSGPIHECHEFAETAGRTAAECTAMQASCFATCVEPTDGGGGGTDAGGGGTDSGASTVDGG